MAIQTPATNPAMFQGLAAQLRPAGSRKPMGFFSNEGEQYYTGDLSGPAAGYGGGFQTAIDRLMAQRPAFQQANPITSFNPAGMNPQQIARARRQQELEFTQRSAVQPPIQAPPTNQSGANPMAVNTSPRTATPFTGVTAEAPYWMRRGRSFYGG